MSSLRLDLDLGISHLYTCLLPTCILMPVAMSFFRLDLDLDMGMPGPDMGVRHCPSPAGTWPV